MESLRIPYALRRVDWGKRARLLPIPDQPQPGDIGLARVETIGKNTRLELANGRASSLHPGDQIAVVFGNRYAPSQFEGYARIHGDACDLLSMGGVCGVLASKHEKVLEPSRLRLLGAIGDEHGRPLRLRDFSLPPIQRNGTARILAICGTAMDAGKTHSAMSTILGLRKGEQRVAAAKLTGTATGRDAWVMRDAGAEPVLDFVDGGYASTYMCSLEDLLDLHRLLVSHASANGVDWIVIEIADGPLQRETAALLQCRRFTETVDAWLFAAGDPLAAAGGVEMLRNWSIEPLAISGLIGMSPLGMREAKQCTGLTCFSSGELQRGDLNERLLEATARRVALPR